MKPSFYCRARRRANWEYDNNQKIKDLNKNYKNRIIDNAIYNIKNMNNLNDKLKYISDLKTNNFRCGTKYKYKCNLSELEVKEILDKCDEELFIAYYGKNKIQHEKNRVSFGTKFLLWLFGLNIILAILNSLIK